MKLGRRIADTTGGRCEMKLELSDRTLVAEVDHLHQGDSVEWSVDEGIVIITPSSGEPRIYPCRVA